jgi:protein-ribulosamine 3-kinase
MFGGIPASFFHTYHEHLPKTEPVDQYEKRAELYEMFHYLNHTVLFGVGDDSSWHYSTMSFAELSTGWICRQCRAKDR